MRWFRVIVIIVLQSVACFSLALGGSSNKLYNLPPELIQPQGGSAASPIDFPDVPRISAKEAALRYRNGQAILIHAGGMSYDKRHIIGAIDLLQEDVTHERVPLPNFPTTGIEIYTYCY